MSSNTFSLDESECSSNDGTTHKYEQSVEGNKQSDNLDSERYSKIVFDMEHRIDELEAEYILNRPADKKKEDYFNTSYVLYELSKFNIMYYNQIIILIMTYPNNI